MATFLRDIFLPILTLSTLVGCLFFAYKFIELGVVGGAVSTGLLSCAIGVFTYYDVRRLLKKIT